MIAPDQVRAITTVAVDPETAFQVFTDEVDLWWKRGPAHRFGVVGDGDGGADAGFSRGAFEGFRG